MKSGFEIVIRNLLKKYEEEENIEIDETLVILLLNDLFKSAESGNIETVSSTEVINIFIILLDYYIKYEELYE